MESQELNTLLWGSLVVGEAAVAGATALKITGQQAAPGLSGTVAAMMAADTTTWVVAAILLAIMGVSTIVVVGWLRRMLHPDDADAGGGSTRAYRDMEYRAAVARARRILADSLPADTHLEDDDLVRYVGDLGKQRLYAQHEDPETTYAITRSGKTRLLVTRRVLEAPGAVLATSTKVDGIALTWYARRHATGGRTLVFDPMGQALGPAPVRWNPILGCEDFNVARERGKAFAMGATTRVDEGNTRWFMERGAQILGYLFHAAALSGQDITAVHRWVSHPEEAVEILRSVGSPTAKMMVSTLTDLMVEMASETMSGFVGTMQGALEPIMINSVLEALTPPKEESFDVESFLSSKDVLWVISPESEGAVASVTTMLADHVVNAAKRMSDLVPGQRLTPPLSCVLDEAANVAPLPYIDQLYSEGPGRGIMTSAFFQDEAQVVKKWGNDTAKVIFQQSRIVYVLGGSKDAEWNERMANLSPEFEERRTSYTRGSTGTSTATHTERRHVLRESDVAGLQFGTALLAPAGHPAVKVGLTDIVNDARWQKLVDEGRRRYDEHLRLVQQAPTANERLRERLRLAGWMDRLEVKEVA